MKRRVVWSLDALDDIDEHAGYVGRENPAAAVRIIDRIERAADLLGDVAIGRPGRVNGTFEKSVSRTPYIISYALRDDTQLLVILRIVHAAQNWPKGSWPD